MLTRTCIAVALFLASFALVPLAMPASAADDPLLVIVGLSFPVNDISLADIKDSFSGRSVKVAGRRIIPINHPLESHLRVGFDRAVLGLEPAAVGRFWVDKRIRAEGTPPTTASTPEIAVRIAASLASSMTYCTKNMLNAKVKALAVNGKDATDPAYPLKR
jgi:hypothetical protein